MSNENHHPVTLFSFQTNIFALSALPHNFFLMCQICLKKKHYKTSWLTLLEGKQNKQCIILYGHAVLAEVSLKYVQSLIPQKALYWMKFKFI